MVENPTYACYMRLEVYSLTSGALTMEKKKRGDNIDFFGWWWIIILLVKIPQLLATEAKCKLSK